MQHINYMQMNKFKNSILFELVAKMTNKKFIKKNTIYEKLQRNIIEIEFNLTQKKQIQFDDSRKYKRNRNFDDDSNDRFNKFSRDSNRENRERDKKSRFEKNHNDSQKNNRDDRRENDRERKRKNRDKKRERREERRENDTFAIEFNIDFVDRKKKQKKRNERQTNESCFKCEFKNH